MEAALLHPGRGRGEVCLCGMETIAGKGKVEQSRTKARLKQEPGAVQGSGRESNRAVPKPWELFCLSTPSWHDCHSQFLRLKMPEKKGKKKSNCKVAERSLLCGFDCGPLIFQKSLIRRKSGLSLKPRVWANKILGSLQRGWDQARVESSSCQRDPKN